MIHCSLRIDPDSEMGKYLRERMKLPEDSNRQGVTRQFSMSQVIRDILEQAAREKQGHAAKYKHLKRGSIVQIHGTYQLQASTPPVEGAYLVAYEHLDNKTFWVRPTTEFFDGRFKMIDPGRLSGT